MWGRRTVFCTRCWNADTRRPVDSKSVSKHVPTRILCYEPSPYFAKPGFNVMKMRSRWAEQIITQWRRATAELRVWLQFRSLAGSLAALPRARRSLLSQGSRLNGRLQSQGIYIRYRSSDCALKHQCQLNSTHPLRPNVLFDWRRELTVESDTAPLANK